MDQKTLLPVLKEVNAVHIKLDDFFRVTGLIRRGGMTSGWVNDYSILLTRSFGLSRHCPDSIQEVFRAVEGDMILFSIEERAPLIKGLPLNREWQDYLDSVENN